MATFLKPGQTTGSVGAIYLEVGPRGGKTKENGVIVLPNKPMPQTHIPKNKWKLEKVIPMR